MRTYSGIEIGIAAALIGALLAASCAGVLERRVPSPAIERDSVVFRV